MAKKNTSFRLEEEQIADLDALVTYYKSQMTQATSDTFHVNVSKASVVEMLIRDRVKELSDAGVEL
jgi:hypothetical protein